MMQRQRDLAAGLNTTGSISPSIHAVLAARRLSLKALWRPKRFIKTNHIEFHPARLNEDLRPPLWAPSSRSTYPAGPLRRRFFGMWVRHGPGVEPVRDVLKHASMPTSRHAARGPCRRRSHGQGRRDGPPERARLQAAGLPVIIPASVQE